MRTFRVLFLSVLSLCLLPHHGSLQSYDTFQLPTTAAITGIAFPTDSTGLITVADTLLYHVRSAQSPSVTFTEHAAVGVINDFREYHPANDLVESPVWASDSSVVVIRDAAGPSVHQEILGSKDGGKTWEMLTPVWHPDLLWHILAVPNTGWYCVYGTDVPGEVYLSRRSAQTLQLSTPSTVGIDTMRHPWLTGIAAPITADRVLLASRSDTLVELNLTADTLMMWKPQIAGEATREEFSLLVSNAQGVILGRHAGTIVRSTDAGYSWHTVTPAHPYANIDWSWSTSVYSAWHDSLWHSMDAGSTWTPTGPRLPTEFARAGSDNSTG